MNSHQVTVILTREIVQTAARHFMRRFIIRSSISDLVFIGIGVTLGLTGIISRELAIGWIVAGLHGAPAFPDRIIHFFRGIVIVFLIYISPQ